MKYTEEMILQSPSGYCMPFEETDGNEIKVLGGYGENKDAATGEKSFNHGIDFGVSHRPLAALASGTVCGIGNDREHGICLTVRYGKYEVIYGDLSNVLVRFGQPVRAGQTVAVSGGSLHMEASFDGEELNPIEFLTMLYGNIQATVSARNAYDFTAAEGGVKTKYDRDKEEIEELMLRFLPSYMEALYSGDYVVPEYTEQSLRNVFSVGAAKNYFFETVPSMANPLGLGGRALPLACKVQNLLIADFLNYLALRHEIYLSSAGGDVKKNFNTRQ
ncbi:MAG: M23 family metallopeptidase [Bacteroidales bacterium]|nr:M23 family metallopeptidase [Bacteroidales bacterium]